MASNTDKTKAPKKERKPRAPKKVAEPTLKPLTPELEAQLKEAISVSDKRFPNDIMRKRAANKIRAQFRDTYQK